MKTIVCFGDSNTWGYNPVTQERYEYEVRWTTVLQRELGDEFLVIPEGLNGRTTVWEDPIELHKNGAAYLPPCLEIDREVRFSDADGIHFETDQLGKLGVLVAEEVRRLV